MTESQRIVLNWRAKLKQMGWPEENIREIVSELCEAGYRQCLDDVRAKANRDENLIANATGRAN